MAQSDNLSYEPLMNAEQVARYLGLAKQTIYDKVHRGSIPHKKIDGALRFRREEIDAWIEAQSGNGEAS